MDMQEFQELIWQKGRELYRPMPWREDTRPYYILVSELMLQQTQVDRVIPKFTAFIARFPDEATLAQASLGEVLTLWSGLGYNRRAKFLHDSAQKITTTHGGVFPDRYEDVLALPGVGPGTAGAIMTYAYSHAVAFIETNVRTVYFHHFFTDGEKVPDTELMPLLERTIDQLHPREFYWALMDYGTWLKKQGAGRILQSAHYKKQSPLKGSVREVRGQIVKQLTVKAMSINDLQRQYVGDDRFDTALAGLLRDGLVVQSHNILHLTK